MSDPLKDRWQIRTTNLLTGDRLYTTEMPDFSEFLGGFMLTMGYSYESCIFYGGGSSDVLDRYQTREAARIGHEKLVDQHIKILGSRIATCYSGEDNSIE